jgi:hypothetical protein
MGLYQAQQQPQNDINSEQNNQFVSNFAKFDLNNTQNQINHTNYSQHNASSTQNSNTTPLEYETWDSNNDVLHLTNTTISGPPQQDILTEADIEQQQLRLASARVSRQQQYHTSLQREDSNDAILESSPSSLARIDSNVDPNVPSSVPARPVRPVSVSRPARPQSLAVGVHVGGDAVGSPRGPVIHMGSPLSQNNQQFSFGG